MTAADSVSLTLLAALLLGWLLDLRFGDPPRLPHLVVLYGKAIACGERKLNRGRHSTAKGGLLAVGLIAAVFAVAWLCFSLLRPFHLIYMVVGGVVVFYCLAGTTLIREVRDVFLALDRSLDDGRRQVARIVGRDTAELSEQEVRKAALETLAENLSDGVVAPLFWLALLGLPGMMAYKMVNTLDSMIGYRTVRYREFGCVAARIDDAANYIPARLTALLMVVADALAGRPRRLASNWSFVRHNARNHASPNSGWPEAALAAILDCRFGGGHYYFGEYFPKPFIGTNDRKLTAADAVTAIRINRMAETMMIAITAIIIIAI